MKKTSVLCAMLLSGSFLISGTTMAEGDKFHNFSQGKNPHANGGCESKGKIAQFHRFHQKKGQQVRVPNSKHIEAQKTNKAPSIDQFI